MIDYVLLAYVPWRKECRVVRRVSDEWEAASSSEQAAIAYVAHGAALDREEAAARIFGEVLEAVGKLPTTERRPRLVVRGAACHRSGPQKCVSSEEAMDHD